MRKDTDIKPDPVSTAELEKAIERINRGAVGSDIAQSNNEVFSAHEVVESYIRHFPLGEKRRSIQKMIDKALGIDQPEKISDSALTEGPIGNGTRDTGIITPTSLGTGLSRQHKKPRDI